MKIKINNVEKEIFDIDNLKQAIDEMSGLIPTLDREIDIECSFKEYNSMLELSLKEVKEQLKEIERLELNIESPVKLKDIEMNPVKIGNFYLRDVGNIKLTQVEQKQE